MRRTLYRQRFNTIRLGLVIGILLSSAPLEAQPVPIPESDQASSFVPQTTALALRRSVASDTFVSSKSPMSKRERIDQLRHEWFTAPTRKLVFDLFQDSTITAVIDRFERIGAAEVFIGHTEEADDRVMIISRCGDAVQARLPGPGATLFEVSSSDLTSCRVAETDVEKITQLIALESDTDIPLGPVGTSSAPFPTQLDFVAPQKPVPSEGGETEPSSSPSSGIQPTVIDAMILYTPELIQILGSQGAVEAQIALSIAYVNEAYRRSWIKARIRLVHYEMVTPDWPHTSSDSWVEELSWLSSNATVASRRTTYGADLAALMCLTTRGGAGDCYGPFSVFNPYPEIFAHETGHNLGCNHDRASGYGCADGFFNFGYTFTGNDGLIHRTIMSYIGANCDLYSNPTNQFRGSFTGIAAGPAAADNARRINQEAGSIAGWKAPTVTVLSSPALNPSATIFTFQISGPGNGTYEVEFTSDYSSWSSLGTFSLVSGSVTVTDAVGSVPSRFYRAKLGSAYLGTQLGYIKKILQPGYTMIANQLDSGDNSISALFLNGLFPDGTRILKWAEHAPSPNWFVSVYDSLYGGWSSPWMTLSPGEGAAIYLPGGSSSVTISFVGQVQPAINQRVRTGWSIQASGVPQGGLVSTLLRFPGIWPDGEGIAPGDQVHKMKDSQGNYDPFTWSGSAWSPQEPLISIGESFFSYKVSTPGYWKRIFWDWP